MGKDVHVVKEVEIPDGVDVKIENEKITVTGPKGSLTRVMPRVKGILMRREDNKVVIESYFADARKRAMIGTIAAHIKNMIVGVTKGYRYKLKVIYSHFPISIKIEGDKFIISNFLGEKAPRVARILPGVKVTVKKNDVIVEGIDIEAVGQTAANIERATKITGFDRRKFMDGIYIYEKEVVEG